MPDFRHPHVKFERVKALINNQLLGRDAHILEDCPGDPWQFMNIFGDRSLASKLSESLPRDELRALIVGLVKFDVAHAGKACGGSVTPVPSLYFKFVKDYPEEEPELTAWIVQNRYNPYDPFGTVLFNDCLNLSDHRARFDERDRERKLREFHEREASAFRAAVKRDREAIRASENLTGAIRRGDLLAVQALLSKGANLSTVQDVTGLSPIEWALKNDRGDLAVFLYKNYGQ